MKDKRGNEIEHGDLVCNVGVLGNRFVVDMNNIDVVDHLESFSERDYIKVGNAHKNPELLEYLETE